MTAPTTHAHLPDERRPASVPSMPSAGAFRRAGGIAALVGAATFVVGIVMFTTMLSEYTTGDPTPAESVAFLVDHQLALYMWILVTLIVFGVALVPMTLALYAELRDRSPVLAQAAAAFGLIWCGLVLATGMISNIRLRVVDDLAATDPGQAAAVWSSLDAVTDGLGGGNELAGAIWVLLVSVAARRSGALPRGLQVLGVVGASAGLATVIPGFEVAEMVFGLGLIAWMVWLGVALLSGGRRDRAAMSR